VNRRISAVIIDTYSDKTLPKLAIEKTLECHAIDKVYTFSDVPYFDGAEFVKIPPITSVKDYEELVLFDLIKIINKDFLIIQWDGFVLNPAQWQQEFLDYDYIGAPHFVDSILQVGNGGFSYRSIRLMEALEGLLDRKVWLSESWPEDLLICCKYRDHLERKGVKFAPLEIARRFAFQEGQYSDMRSIFGFHSPWCLPLFFSENGLLLIADKIIERISNFKILTTYLENCRERKFRQLLIQSVDVIEARPALVEMIDKNLMDGESPWCKRFQSVMSNF
jgi:hypothetical protein